MTAQVSKLSNGMTVVSQDLHYLRSTALGVWVDCGARHELEQQHGISHLLEHMAFKGTKRRSAREIAEEIEAVGGELNASTSVETTGYYARVLSDDTALGVDILSDILNESIFDKTELQREQMVILQEIGAASDQPDDLVFDLFQATAYPDQPIGRSILGTEASVTGFSADDLRSYLGTHYAADRLVLSAAGHIDHDELVKLAEKGFGHIPAKPNVKKAAATYRGGEGRLPRDLHEANILLGFEGRSYYSDDYFAMQVLAATLGGGMSSRLFQEVREQRGLCYAIYAFHWGYADSGVFAIHAATGEETVEDLFPVLVDQLRSVADTVTDEEVARAKAQIKASLLMAMESPAARAGQLARQIMIYGETRSPDELVDRIEAVDARHVTDLMKSILDGSHPTLASIGPIDKVPAVDQLKSALLS